jgi:hypothetical protein
MRKVFLFLFLSLIFLLKSQTNCPQIGTYFGKVQHDDFKGICKDYEGNIYAIGNTYNNDLPTTSGAFQPLYKNDYEAYIVKFDSCGAFIWCTYFGTNDFDSGEKIAFSAIDTSIVITGYTNGTDLFTTPGAFQPNSSGNYDCFIAKFGLNGQVKWATYFGASSADFSYTVFVDKSGNILIGGTSLSSTLYTSQTSFQQNNSGATDAYIAKFNKGGNLIFSTFYGGVSSEDIHAITSDQNRNIIAVGGSFSNNLSTTAGCYQSSSNGGMEIYVIKLDSLGNRIFSTYIGGSGTDDSYGVCTDNNLNIYLTGHTNSNDFFVSPISFQTFLSGMNDNFCIKLSPSGTMQWSSLFGGDSFDNNVSCTINGNNEVISLINTQSTNFPVLGTNTNSTYQGNGDLMLVKINSVGQLVWSSYAGGDGGESAGDLVLKHNRVILSGGTGSSNLIFPLNNYQMANNGQSDGFIMTIDIPDSPLTQILKKPIDNCKTSIIGRKLHTTCEYTLIRTYDVFGNELSNNSSSRESFLEHLTPNQLYLIAFYNPNGLIKIEKLYLAY